MATTTITTYSDAVEAALGSSNVQAPANLSRSKCTIAPFRWTCASETAISVGLVKIPKGARLISGAIVANGALANSAQISIGLAAVDGTGIIDDAITGFDTAGVAMTATVADQVACLKAANTQSTTLVSFLLTTALGYGYEAQKDLWLTVTTSVGAVATEVVRGHIIYAVD